MKGNRRFLWYALALGLLFVGWYLWNSVDVDTLPNP